MVLLFLPLLLYSSLLLALVLLLLLLFLPLLLPLVVELFLLINAAGADDYCTRNLRFTSYDKRL